MEALKILKLLEKQCPCIHLPSPVLCSAYETLPVCPLWKKGGRQGVLEGRDQICVFVS